MLEYGPGALQTGSITFTYTAPNLFVRMSPDWIPLGSNIITCAGNLRLSLHDRLSSLHHGSLDSIQSVLLSAWEQGEHIIWMWELVSCRPSVLLHSSGKAPTCSPDKHIQNRRIFVKCRIWTWVYRCGYQSNFWPGPSVLNFSDQMGTDFPIRSPHSIYWKLTEIKLSGIFKIPFIY